MSKIAVEIDLPGRPKLTMSCAPEQETELRAAVASLRDTMLRNAEQNKSLASDRNLLLSCLSLVLQSRANIASPAMKDEALAALTLKIQNAL